jgi:hypothetical protein
MGFNPGEPQVHQISLRGKGSGSIPGRWFGGPDNQPNLYGNYGTVACHEGVTGNDTDQSWNDVTEWYTDRPFILPPGPTADEPVLVGADIQVTITWTTDIASTSYVDYGITESYENPESPKGNDDLVTDHSVTLTNLTNYEINHYRVRSAGPLGTEVVSADNIIDGDLDTIWIEQISFPPLAPTLHAEEDNSCELTCPVTLEWDAAINPGNGGPVQYQVQVGDATPPIEYDTGWKSADYFNCEGGGICTWDVTLRPDPTTIWSWRVRARDTDYTSNISDWSSPLDDFTVTQPPGSPPLDPIIINEPDIASPVSAYITLQWEHVVYSDPLDYFVQVNSKPDFSGTGSNDHISDWIAEGTLCSGGTCSWTTPELPTDTTWYWRVQARNQNDHGLISPWSTVDSFTIYPLIINESFETNPGYDEAWTPTEGTGCTLNPDSAVPGTTPPPDAGSECLQSISSSSGWIAYATRDLGSVQTKTFTRFYVYVESEGLGNNQNKVIGALQDDSNNAVFIFRLNKNNSGQLQFMLQIYNNSLTYDHIYNISTGVWYRIDVKYDNTTGVDTWEWRVNEETQLCGGGCTLRGTHYNGIQKWNFGFIANYQTITGTIYFDLITVNTGAYY